MAPGSSWSSRVEQWLGRLRPDPQPAAEPNAAPQNMPAPRSRQIARPRSAPTPELPRIALALQGGGAHGAFTWGVLDRLLTADRFRIGAVSGTSAGALNAVVMAHGLAEGGPDAARAALRRLWRGIGMRGAFSPWRSTPMAMLTHGWNMDGAATHAGLDLMTQMLSPYQFNPLDMNPLRDLLADMVDFERLRIAGAVDLYIGATNVRTGQGRIFMTPEIGPETVLASCALPWLHHAVDVDGEHYWDGAYTANPPLLPLVEHDTASDIVLVQIDPPDDPDLPVNARAIQNRARRLAFNAPLAREIETIGWMRRAAGEDSPMAARLRTLRLHRIEAHETLRAFGQSSKLNPEWPFLKRLFDIGVETAEAWLTESGKHVGAATTPEAPIPAVPDEA